jgi:predicted Zn-dependent peptidase
LPNGLEIAAECNPSAYTMSMGFFVKTGARDESDDIAGVSHFLEHMVFKGTARRSADDVNRQFDEMGAYYNAYTNEESTVFYAAVLPEYQAATLDMLADILRPSLREEDFNVEKKVILEEIQMYEDQPPFGADEKCRAAFFGNHPLGRSVLGTLDSIKQLEVAAMRQYFERRYAPNNIVLVATGRVDFDALVADTERFCGAWKKADNARLKTPFEAKLGFHRIERPTANQQYALQMAVGPDADHPLRNAAKLLAMVLGDDTGSRLYWELIDPGVAEQVETGHGEYEGAGVFLTYLSCAPEDAEESLERLEKVYHDAEAEGFTEAEVQQAKSKVKSRLVLSSERPRGRLSLVAGDWVYRREYFTLEQELEHWAAIKADDLTEVLRQFPLSKSLTFSIGPLGEG